MGMSKNRNVEGPVASYTEPSRALPVVAAPDVLVVGGGPAGIGAAIASARSGARTLLVERYGFIGGNLTIAMVNPMFTFHDRKGRQVIRGIAGELVDRLVAPRWSDGHVADLTFDNASMTPFDPEGMKIVLLRMVRDSGCELLLHTLVTGASAQNGSVKAVIIESKSGRQVIRPKYVIDCSADADVAAQAGCSFVLGRKEDGRMQPVTLFFRIGGVDDVALRGWMKANRHLLKDAPSDAEIDTHSAVSFLGMNKMVKEAMARGEYPQAAAARILFYQLPQKDQIAVNATRLQGIDGTDVRDLTWAELETREQAWSVFSFLKAHVGGFDRAFMLDTGIQVGVRETRHIVGDYEMVEDDVLAGRSFEDGIACGTFAIDIHPPEGEKQVFTGSGRVVYEIPYRSLLPKGMGNMWVAGRCLCATHAAFGSARVMATCMGIGQGAGTAAAYAARYGVTNREVDTAAIRKQLVADGQYLLNEGIDDEFDEALRLDRAHGSGAEAAHHNPFEAIP